MHSKTDSIRRLYSIQGPSDICLLSAVLSSPCRGLLYNLYFSTIVGDISNEGFQELMLANSVAWKYVTENGEMIQFWISNWKIWNKTNNCSTPFWLDCAIRLLLKIETYEFRDPVSLFCEIFTATKRKIPSFFFLKYYFQYWLRYSYFVSLIMEILSFSEELQFHNNLNNENY